MPPKKKTHQNKPKAKATRKTGIVSHLKSGRRATGNGGYAEDIGGSIGSWLGQKAGSLFKSITGLGDYRVQSNTLVAATDPPVLSNTTSATRVQHREYITDIYGSTEFTNRVYAINPGLGSTFPWLNAVAQCFEQYRLHGLIFEFKSTSASALNSTNTALGTVIMATEYNVTEPSFLSKREMENHVYSTSAPPAVSSMHPIECAKDVSILSDKYVRGGPVASSDLRFNDMGNFQLATVGMQASANIGELWCTYDVELIKPKLPSTFSTISAAHYTYDSVLFPAVVPPSLGTTGKAYGTSTYTLRGVGNSPVTIDANAMTFLQSGRYLIIWQYRIDDPVNDHSWVFGHTNTAGITAVPAFARSSGTLSFSIQAPPDDAANSALVAMAAVVIDVSTQVIPPVLTAGFTVSNPATEFFAISSDIYVIPLPTTFSDTRLLTLEDKLAALANQFRLLKDKEEEKFTVVAA